jgi:uncharacterized protein
MSTVFTNLPGVRIQEVRLGAPPIAGVGTSTAGFVGKAPTVGPPPARFKNVLHLVTSADQFINEYLKDPAAPEDATKGAQDSTNLSFAVLGFFQNGGTECYVVNTDSDTPADIVAGIKLLETREEIDIIAAPGMTDVTVYQALEDQAKSTGNRFAILDPPPKVAALTELTKGGSKRPKDSIWAAFYYPRIQVSPLLPNDPKDTVKNPIFIPPSGHIAGLYARVDGQRGVHKAPANEALSGALGVEDLITDAQQNVLNEDGVDVIRLFSAGPVVWGARTLLDKDADKTFRYINIRRLTTFIEQSLRIGLRFAVFEPNNLALRATITRSVRGFLDGVWRDGALFGATADEAYYVRFPEPFNTDAERALGKLTIEIGIRVSFPAEFIIIRIGLLDRAANAA